MLHQRDTVRDSLDDDLFASSDMSKALAKYRMHAHEHDPRAALQCVKDELMLDGNSRQNLATFCQTWAEPEVREIMAFTLDKNMVDKDEYPQTAELEERCVHMLADLWNSPKREHHRDLDHGLERGRDARRHGLLWKWRAAAARGRQAHRQAEPGHRARADLLAQVRRYWDVELREIPMEGDRLIMTPEEVLKRVDENTIGVVPTLGVTFTGPTSRSRTSQRARPAQEETGLDVPIHVDGASGGFLAPFCEPDLRLGLPAPAGEVDQHLGPQVRLAPLGVGWMIWRDNDELPEELSSTSTTSAATCPPSR